MPNLSTFAPQTLNQSPSLVNTHRLFAPEAEQLLKSLLQSRWQRLSSEYHDPLGMLFGNRAKQWTAGWDQQQESLYLLVWETDSWQEKPIWSIYQDGVLLFQEEDGFSRTRSALFHQLMESDTLPFLSEAAILIPLTDFRRGADARKIATNALVASIKARPEVFDLLKEPLLKTLETELSDGNWPVLEILKLHRVAHKVNLVDIIRQCVEMGLFRTQADATRLTQAFNRLQSAFDHLSATISPLFLPGLQEANQLLRTTLTRGNWRIRLHTISANREASPKADQQQAETHRERSGLGMATPILL